MGWRMRRRINLGFGCHINISKSGIGYSWGMKGVRFTKTARGGVRETYSVPGTGISYVQEHGPKRQNGVPGAQPVQQPLEPPAVSTERIEISEYQDPEYAVLLKKLKAVQRYNYISTPLLATAVLSIVYPVFALTALLGAILKVLVYTKLRVPMEYSFDEESRQNYEHLSALWMQLGNNAKFWQVISESSLERRTNGGASRGINRIAARVTNQLPFYILSNVPCFGIKLRKQALYFMPDKLLIVSAMDVGAVSYLDILLDFKKTSYVEEELVPNDAEVIGQTWLKVNKNGTPDKRFKDNRQLPICAYGTIIIRSKNKDLYVELMCSNNKTVEGMKKLAQNPS